MSVGMIVYARYVGIPQPFLRIRKTISLQREDFLQMFGVFKPFSFHTTDCSSIDKKASLFALLIQALSKVVYCCFKIFKIFKTPIDAGRCAAPDLDNRWLHY